MDEKNRFFFALYYHFLLVFVPKKNFFFFWKNIYKVSRHAAHAHTSQRAKQNDFSFLQSNNNGCCRCVPVLFVCVHFAHYIGWIDRSFIPKLMQHIFNSMMMCTREFMLHRLIWKYIIVAARYKRASHSFLHKRAQIHFYGSSFVVGLPLFSRRFKMKNIKLKILVDCFSWLRFSSVLFCCCGVFAVALVHFAQDTLW